VGGDRFAHSDAVLEAALALNIGVLDGVQNVIKLFHPEFSLAVSVLSLVLPHPVCALAFCVLSF
jgi:hypothetical protein